MTLLILIVLIVTMLWFALLAFAWLLCVAASRADVLAQAANVVSPPVRVA